ncbi:MAG: hypothetical protein L6R36_007988 [Xanthoria steineri]|nr:MAG: hypothetical protein L6R36_007988 [Xanthoria steineri]
MASPSNLLAPTDEVAAHLLGLSADVIAQLTATPCVLAGEDELTAKRRRRQTTLVDLNEDVVEAAEQPKKKKMWRRVKDALRSWFWSCCSPKRAS